MKIQVSSFAGRQPRVASHKLAASAAQVAINCQLTSGALTSLRRPFADASAASEQALRGIYRYRGGWLVWQDDVRAVPSPIASDGHDRLYFTQAGTPPRYITRNDVAPAGDVTVWNTTPRPLGLPVPSSAPDVSVVGGSGDQVGRTYVCTFVSDCGEEGPSSPPSAVVTGAHDGTWTVDGLPGAAPAGYGHIEKVRIYRSLSGSSETAFQFVDEVAVSVGSYEDSKADQELNEPLPSLDWIAPPDDMRGLIELPGGVFAGFSGNEICFSEPMMPHAWPDRYRLTVNHTVKALGAFGSTLVVLTDAYPALVFVSSPETATMENLNDVLPCLSAEGVVSTAGGVIYPSTAGLVMVSAAGANLVTRDLFTSREWEKYRPTTLRAGWSEGQYLAFWGDAVEGGGFIFDPAEPGGRFVDLNYWSSCVWVEPELDVAWISYPDPDGSLKAVIARQEGSGQLLGYVWKSKEFVTPEPVNFARGRITVDYEGAITGGAGWTHTDASLGEPDVGVFPLGGDGSAESEAEADAVPSAYVRIFADGVLRYEQLVTTDRLFALPGGFRARRWEIEISGTVPIAKVEIATSGTELVA